MSLIFSRAAEAEGKTNLSLSVTDWKGVTPSGRKTCKQGNDTCANLDYIVLAVYEGQA